MKALRGGRGVVKSKRVSYRAEVESVKVRSAQPFPWQVDGDYLGELTEIDVNLERDALTIVVPLTAEAPSRRRRVRR
jgi:diacylglycerol kinase family enzyme